MIFCLCEAQIFKTAGKGCFKNQNPNPSAFFSVSITPGNMLESVLTRQLKAHGGASEGQSTLSLKSTSPLPWTLC